MPDYEVTDPRRGITLTVTGPAPPSQGMLDALFADAAQKTQVDPAYKDAATYGADAQAMNKAMGVDVQRREKPSIGPVTSTDTAPVTLGDLLDNPRLAIDRMITLTKQGVSDPRTTIPAAIGVVAGELGLGPRSFASTRGLVTSEQAAAPVAVPLSKVGIGQALRENVKLDDLVDAIPGSHSAKGAYRVLRGVQRAMQQSGKSVETPGGPVTTPEPPVAPKAEPAASIPTPKTSSPLDQFEVTPAELKDAVKWHQQGVAPEVIRDRILQARLFTGRMGTATPEEAAAKIESSFHTGKF